ncbi:hypothetical protein MHU86_12384 [Fragilaria crotonensis]|nr:hypothetical protein MHU86_12384 [Fragilaria crotonensis]
MASSSYQNAIRLNNQGVLQFENGNYEHARLLFREALEAVKISMAAFSESDGANAGPSVGFGWSKNGPLHAELGLPIPAASNFIFRRALVLLPSCEVLPTRAELTEESTAIIYNLALAHMISGFLTNCSSLLDRSRKFFEIVTAMRQRRTESAKLISEQLLDTAIYNNLGWINEEFCDYHAAQQFYHEVSARLGSLNHSGFVDQKDCEGFITNLVLDAHPDMAAAA